MSRARGRPFRHPTRGVRYGRRFVTRRGSDDKAWLWRCHACGSANPTEPNRPPPPSCASCGMKPLRQPLQR